MKRLLIATLSLWGCASPYQQLIEPVSPGSPVTVLAGVDVFVGDSDELLHDQDVVIRGERIESVAPTGDGHPSGATVIDGAGLTVLPGFIDAHAHFTSPGAAPWQSVPADPEHNLHGFLYAGVTTIYDLGGDPRVVSKWEKKAEAKEILAPNIVRSHVPITVKGSHPIPSLKVMLPFFVRPLIGAVVPTIEDPAQAPELVAKAKKQGADFIKITRDQIPPGTPFMPDAELEALVKAAHDADLLAFVHIGSPEDAIVATRAGADVLAHGPWRGVITEEQADEIAKSGTYVTYTIAGWNNLGDMIVGQYLPSRLDREISPPDLLDPVTGTNGLQFWDYDPLREMALEAAKWRGALSTNVQRLERANVRWLIGSDSPLPGVYPGSSFHEELRVLNEAGVPAARLLRAATYDAARVFWEDPQFGLVAPGKVADLVVVRGNPVEDIRRTADIAYVFRAGTSIRRHAR